MLGNRLASPAKHIVNELPANKDNYGYLVSTPNQSLHYDIVFCSDNEDFGFHSASEWYQFLTAWKKEIENPVVVR